MPDDRPRLSLGAVALRRWRLSQQLTQFELSSRLGLRYDKAARIERGYNRPNLALAVKLEEICGIPVRMWLQPVPPHQRRQFLSTPLTRGGEPPPDDEGDDGTCSAA